MAESDWKHYKLINFYASPTAKRYGIDNEPKGEYFSHVDELVLKILDPLRDAWGSSITITSGYRCLELNKAVGSKSKKSAHLTAYAADMVPSNGKIEEFKAFTMKWLLDNKIDFDLFINEYDSKSSWVHIGIRNLAGALRHQYKLFRNNKYTTIDPLTFKGINGDQSYQNTAISTLQSLSTSVSSNQNNVYGTSLTFISTTNSTGYGQLTGSNVYLNEIDYEAILNNDIFVKSESGEPLIDPETGEFIVSDEYLMNSSSESEDEELDKSECENEPDPNKQAFLDALTSDEVETVSGITYNSDGSYAVSLSKSLRELMQMVWTWWELIMSLKLSIAEFEKTLVSSNNEQGTVIINAEVYAKAAFDKFGNAMKFGLCCPCCSEKVKTLLFGGYCSAACMIKDQAKKLMSYLLEPNDKYKEFNDVIMQICQLLDHVSLTMNAIALIPDIIKELCHFPEKYKRYVEVKICEGFAELQILIEQAMSKKNELMKKLLDKMKFGTIMKPFAYVYIEILQIKSALDIAQLEFDTYYTAIMTSLKSLRSTGGSIEALSFAWATTPRSFISPMPYTCPDAGKLFVNLPGGSGLPDLSLIKPLMPSGMCNFDFSKVDTFIQSLFPALTPIDYYLDPELFEIRYLFSDQSDLVLLVKQYISDFLVGGPDYLPSFENLLPMKKFTNFVKANGEIADEMILPNIGYAWFLLGLADAWAPHSQSLVGSVIHPEK